MFHAFKITRCSYGCRVFSTHRHQASTTVQHTQCPCRFVILATKKALNDTSFETDLYIHRKYQIPGRYIHTYAVCSCVWRLWVVFLGHGGGALGIFKPSVCTYNQAWTFSLSASHYFSFLSKRSGRRMPPAERSALYVPTRYQVLFTSIIYNRRILYNTE